MAFFAGALLDRPPGPRYVEALRFAELAFRAPHPRPKTLAKWRRTMPEDFVTSLVVPSEAIASPRGALRIDAGVEATLGWLREAAVSTRARFVVLRTGSDVTPGARNRERLRAFVERLPRDEGRSIVWSPAGLWEADEIASFAETIGAVPALDPLIESIPDVPLRYARLRALGARPRFGRELLERVAAALEDADEAFVAIESPRSFQEASALQKIAAHAPP